MKYKEKETKIGCGCLTIIIIIILIITCSEIRELRKEIKKENYENSTNNNPSF